MQGVAGNHVPIYQNSINQYGQQGSALSRSGRNLSADRMDDQKAVAGDYNNPKN